MVCITVMVQEERQEENVTINNVIAGDKIVVYMASSNAATGTLVFKYLGTR